LKSRRRDGAIYCKVKISSIAMDTRDELSYESIQAAYHRIKPYIHETAVLTSATMDRLSTNEKQLFFKAECFQKTGSFKARGAMNAVLLASNSGLYKGISTHSSGNHAQALAWASDTLKSLPAHIVMPSNCPTIKKDAVVGYGASVYICEPTLQAREQMSEEVSKSTGPSSLHVEHKNTRE
jgi:threonine dehydratase